MARVNITIPDDLYRRAKTAGLNISLLARRAVTEELDRLDKIAGLEALLADLDAELGPVTDAERADAQAWAEQVYGAQSDRQRSA
ncbi:MAG: type II toxin-antitoxin system CcdA family antitoxin [Egibacteraceae bacterium]